MPIDLPSLASPSPALDRRQRLSAFFDMWLVDHGFIRDIYCNLHPVADGVWRSAQPAPHHLRRAKRMGIRSVLNLRGRRDRCGSYILERDACQDLGLALVDFPIRSRGLLERDTLLAAAQVFNDIEFPVLMHCKSGADRAGFMAALFLFLYRDIPLRQAMKKHLSLVYGHVKQAKTGIIDFFFERFLDTGGNSPQDFLNWLATDYDRPSLEAEFHESWVAGLVIDWILRRE